MTTSIFLVVISSQTLIFKLLHVRTGFGILVMLLSLFDLKEKVFMMTLDITLQEQRKLQTTLKMFQMDRNTRNFFKLMDC